jgi:hypothetical protein
MGATSSCAAAVVPGVWFGCPETLRALVPEAWDELDDKGLR